MVERRALHSVEARRMLPAMPGDGGRAVALGRAASLLLLLPSLAIAADGRAEALAALAAGRYEQVAALAQKAGPRDRDAAEVLISRAEIATGRVVEAERRLTAVARRRPVSVPGLEARVRLGRLLAAGGRRAEADAIWNALFDDYERGRLDKKSAAALTAVGIAARGLGSFHDAVELFGEAQAADPRFAPARLESAETFLEKYASAEAERDALALLQLTPDDADARELMARIRVEQGEVPAANREIARALAINPRHAAALLVDAGLALEVDDRAHAEARCREVLAVDPRNQLAHSLLGASRLLADDLPSFSVEKAAVAALHPGSARFLHVVAETLVRAHRYEEAAHLEEEAIALDPTDAIALAAWGEDLLRLGDEARAHEALTRAYALDRFNVRAHNLLELLETVIPRDYTLVEAGHFSLRTTRLEAPALTRILPPVLESEWRELTARYGYTPPSPVRIELYADPRHYAVRTVGLPRLDALGVTFGRVVTARSPVQGDFNFAMMLWHEVAHVFALGLSKNRVPRWFTEGLAEWETEHHRAEWRRTTHADLARALAAGRLLSVNDLDIGFVRARSVAEVVVAYHEAAEAIGFVVRRWGFPAIVKALSRFGEGRSTIEVLREITGLDSAGFDAAFRTDLLPRLAVYRGQLLVRPSQLGDLDELREAAGAHPADVHAQALLALGLVAHHQTREAESAVARALVLAPDDPEACFAAASLAAARPDSQSLAEDRLRALLAAGVDGYDVRMLLASVLAAMDRLPAAISELERAALLDPEASEPHELLAAVAVKAHTEENALREWTLASSIDVHDLALARKVTLGNLALSRWDKTRAAAERAEFIAPYDPALRLASARAALALHDPRAAIAELEIALAAPPQSLGDQGPALRALLAEAEAAARPR